MTRGRFIDQAVAAAWSMICFGVLAEAKKAKKPEHDP